MITFIIPSINRPTLKRTLESLIMQTIPDWKAIVIFDGVNATLPILDSRISAINIKKTGKLNHAGSVRNVGIEQATTEWIGFVDDDDTISPNYLEKFREELSLKPTLQTIIFRMLQNANKILPPQNCQDIIRCQFGISFCMLKTINYRFNPSGFEDYDLLKRMKDSGEIEMCISKYTTYFVRSFPTIIEEYDRKYFN